MNVRQRGVHPLPGRGSARGGRGSADPRPRRDAAAGSGPRRGADLHRPARSRRRRALDAVARRPHPRLSALVRRLPRRRRTRSPAARRGRAARPPTGPLVPPGRRRRRGVLGAAGDRGPAGLRALGPGPDRGRPSGAPDPARRPAPRLLAGPAGLALRIPGQGDPGDRGHRPRRTLPARRPGGGLHGRAAGAAPAGAAADGRRARRGRRGRRPHPRSGAVGAAERRVVVAGGGPALRRLAAHRRRVAEVPSVPHAAAGRPAGGVRRPSQCGHRHRDGCRARGRRPGHPHAPPGRPGVSLAGPGSHRRRVGPGDARRRRSGPPCCGGCTPRPRATR